LRGCRASFGRLSAAAVAIALLTVIGATTGTARAAAGSESDYTVASFSIESHAGLGALITSWNGVLCLVPPEESCFSGLPELVFPGLTSSGMTVWTDPSSPNFTAIVDELTNGHPGLLSWSIEAPITGVGAGIGAVSERDLLDDQVGPSGVDLAGYRIDRIGLRADTVTFEYPGGVFTNYVFRGTFLFEGGIATKDVCKSGGWRSLHGPGGSNLDNQGQCIGLVNTGGQ
jgi:hypothetical protein